MSQHIGNTVAKRAQHVAPNNVATCCVGMLRSFGRGFIKAIVALELLTDDLPGYIVHAKSLSVF